MLTELLGICKLCNREVGLKGEDNSKMKTD